MSEPVPIRPPTRPKPPKPVQLSVQHTDGLTISLTSEPADVLPFPSAKPGKKGPRR
jgi:hypothetical protein